MSRIIVIIGPPGAGKGTQARLISEKYGYPQISTGDLLRSIARNEDPLGREVKQVMDAGRLVSDDILSDILSERISLPDCRQGFILDGYPRTIPQARLLESLATRNEKSVVLLRIGIDEDLLVKRMTGRMTCGKCGQIYNSYFRPPKVERTCDQDGALLVTRSDDRLEAVSSRLAAYHAMTEPLIGYYGGRESLITVDGGLEVNEVFSRICTEIDKHPSAGPA
ncbi:MAG: adenylate kinase [Acidobacteria bacterium]|nr:adenylate kinase [Acidobacteriota bacterium]